MKYENEMLKAIHQDAKTMCKVDAITKEKLSDEWMNEMEIELRSRNICSITTV